MASFFNSSLLPSPSDLLWAVPRLAHRASIFAFADIPEQLDLLLSRAKLPGSAIADATAHKSNVSLLPSGTFAIKNTAASAASSAAASSSTAAGTGSGSFMNVIQDWGAYRLSNIDGIFSYLASRWAISTFIIALILNRAHVYASSRRHLQLNWKARFLLRILPIVLFTHQIVRLLQTMHCQTGPLEFPESASFPTSFTNEKGPLYRLSSALLFWQDHETSCINSGMMSTTDDHSDFIGSSAILWPLFLDFCISHVVETISSALQGRQPMAETGMTIFEHSLAFAEAEAVVRSSVGLGFFGLPRFSSPAAVSKPNIPGTQLSRQALLKKLNVPPEVLLIGLISCGSHLTSQSLGVLGLQSRFRLVNTAIWGVCFMSAFLWSFWKFAEAPIDDDMRVLRYPTVCIIGFIPHMLIFFGIVVCACIYAIALVITMISPPTREFREGSLMNRLRMAHGNLQANVSLARINFSWREEFYTTLLKIGFYVMNAASEAVYFNETVSVLSGTSTWLEEKRAAELADMAKRMQKTLPTEIQGDTVHDGMVSDAFGMVDDQTVQYQDGQLLYTGYARERKIMKSATKISTASMKEEGVGGNQRTGRWLLAVKLGMEVWSLIVRIWARVIIATCSKIGLGSYTKRLEDLARRAKHQRRPEPKVHKFWTKTENGRTALAHDSDVDVEAETRRRFKENSELETWNEDMISDNLYEWWKIGGQWGELDSSGDYVPSVLDNDDLTSMISEAPSVSDVESEVGWEIRGLDEDEDALDDSGRRTPTQSDYRATPFNSSRESSPNTTDAPLAHLARLLSPKTPEDRESAALLSRRLTSNGAMTRSRYRQSLAADQARVFGPATYAMLSQARLSPQDEENVLEQILISRRRTRDQAKSPESRGTGWADGGEGLGADGPQCVVCHSAPRSIIVWPCRCLSLCEECRVSLAVNNFGSCVCCRRDVVAFSRLYVP